MNRYAWAIGSLGALSATGLAQEPTPQRPLARVFHRDEAKPAAPVANIPAVAEAYREAVARVVNQPTLTAHATNDEFRAGIYDWLLDHPDRASLAWRRLGVTGCMEIMDRGQGWFGWDDGDGSLVNWTTVHRGDGVRVWYAEGQGKTGAVMPTVKMQAVAVVRDTRRRDATGRVLVKHECDLYLHTDSKAAATLTKLLGAAAPRLAEQGATQLLLFFSTLTKYCDQHPEDINELLGPKR